MKEKKIRLLLGISGGIAAYKIPLLIRLLIQDNVEIKVVLTKAARTLVGEDALRTVSENPVFLDETPPVYDMDHIRLAEWADLFLISPATANTIAKIAHGIADNLLTTLALSFDGPILIAPAMNTIMWENPATCDNITTLKERGVHVLPVSSGPLACGDDGAGRMISIESIVEFVLGAGLPRCFTSKKILIASGPTAEPLDPVRVITNRSSGRMGAALASAAMCMGADVTVVSGPSEVDLPEGVTVERVMTSAEMADALHSYFGETDVCIMTAAISDFRPRNYSDEKIKRLNKGALSIELVPNQDIAADLAKKKKKQYLVCFSLETGDDEKRAAEKMRKKGCDMMVLNSIDSSLGKEMTKVSILFPGKTPQKIDPMSKRDCAQVILQSIAKRLGLSNG